MRLDGEHFVQLLNGGEISEVGKDVRSARPGGNERVARKVVRSDNGCSEDDERW